ncbi:MAG: hypothetical protein GF310_12010, partial [candidate division Zixibacteria bacterium]|nr:hypothetical protein [candidate division Zixibacteria bacterium]
MTSLIFSGVIFPAGSIFGVVELLILGFSIGSGPIFEPVAFAGDLDDLGSVEDTIEDGGGGGYVADRDLRGAVEEIKDKVRSNIELPQGYFVEYGGQFESEEEATRTVTLLSIVSIIAILVFLYLEFGNFRQAILVMVNLPLALIGGIVSIFFTEGIISIASLVGFIILLGIAVRNGILMVSHYNHLMDKEYKSLKDAVVQG